jgi:hypothetical protein
MLRYDAAGVLHLAQGGRAMCSLKHDRYVPAEGALAADGETANCVWCVLLEMMRCAI